MEPGWIDYVEILLALHFGNFQNSSLTEWVFKGLRKFPSSKWTKKEKAIFYL